MSETNIQRKIQLELSKHPETRLLRNETGAYQAKNGSWVQYGLCKGSSDLIGWHTITITEEMVGKQVAVFTAQEVKTNKGRATPEQQTFIKNVKRAGGIAAVTRSPEDTMMSIRKFEKSLLTSEDT